VGKRPWGVALASDGRTLYSANGLSDDVSVIDTTTLQVTGTISVGQAPWGIAIGAAR
jgi:YVTN family beta-propeller protein